MTGTVWIISYVVLCFTVLVMALAIGSLFREVGARSQAITESREWPFSGLAPGSVLPESLAETVAAALDADVNMNERSTSGFCIFASDAEDAYPVVMSAAAVADRWESAVAVVVERRGGEVGWVDLLPDALREHVVFVERAFEQLGIQASPITSYLRDGAVIEAAAGVLAPSKVEQHFKFVAAPVFSLSPR